MSVSSPDNKISYSGDGSTTAFAFPYYFIDADHIKVVERDTATGAETAKTKDTDYTVAGAGVESGGTVTATTAPAAGKTWVIYREVPLKQETRHGDASYVNLETLENDFDLQAMMAQQLAEMLARTLVYPISTPDEDVESVAEIINTISGYSTAAQAAQTAAELAETGAEAAQAAAEAARDEAVDAAAVLNIDPWVAAMIF